MASAGLEVGQWPRAASRSASGLEVGRCLELNRSKDREVEAPVPPRVEGAPVLVGALHVGLDIRDQVGQVLWGVQISDKIFLNILPWLG